MTSRDGGQPTTTGATVRRAKEGRRAPVFPVLRMVASPDAGQLGAVFPLRHETYLFGRSREAQNRVRDQRMSRLHARISPAPNGGYIIEDRETTNGTFLDGRRVHGQQPLDGDVLSMGDTLFVVDRPADRDLLPSSPAAEAHRIKTIAGVSFATAALRASVATIADRPGPVLLLGPTGVGKEVTARAVHDASGRTGEFVAVNCAAIPRDLAESQFFGYYRGAFTGADTDQDGFFRASSGGTLFLDEVGELPADLQPKLLRVLEDQIVQPLGSGPSIKLDLRVVAATNADLEAGSFRTDLLARLREWVLHIPPLVERKADIIELWNTFLGRESTEGRVRPATAEFCEALLLHDWPMNARELHNFARRMDGLVQDAEEFRLDHLPKAFQAPLLPRFDDPAVEIVSGAAAADEVPSEDEAGGKSPSRERLIEALIEVKGNVKLAAERNGWHRTTLYRWLRRYQIEPDRYR